MYQESDTAKKKAVDKDLMLWSMDDKEIYGEEFFYLGFGDAVTKNLLSDYKVVVFAVSEKNIPVEIQRAADIEPSDVAKIIGTCNAHIITSRDFQSVLYMQKN